MKNTHPYTYRIKDTKDELIKGSFYEPELQATKQSSFRVEKILKRRKTKSGKKEVYVKWLGYSKDFNQWIPEEDIVR